jgi:TRAP-type C4-dicarboxylate transport system permease small subunit
MGPQKDPEESIFGPTETVFTTPDVNLGVPKESRFIRALSNSEMVISVALFAGIFFGVMHQVIGRYFPVLSWVGAGELALLSMIAMTFMMMGYLTGRNGHIVIEVFDGVLRGKKLFVALRMIAAAIMVLTSIALVYDASVKIGLEWTRVSAAMGIPLGILYIFAFIGGLSTGIHSIWKIPHANRPERQLEISEMEG